MCPGVNEQFPNKLTKESKYTMQSISEGQLRLRLRRDSEYSEQGSWLWSCQAGANEEEQKEDT